MIDWRTSRLFILFMGLMAAVLGIAGFIMLQERGVTLATIQDTVDIGAFFSQGDEVLSPSPGVVAGADSGTAPELPNFPTVTISVPERSVFTPPEPTPVPEASVISTLAQTLAGS